jgi:hypothetical protein
MLRRDETLPALPALKSERAVEWPNPVRIDGQLDATGLMGNPEESAHLILCFICHRASAIWHPLLVRGIGIPLAIIFAMTTWLERGATATAD